MAVDARLLRTRRRRIFTLAAALVILAFLGAAAVYAHHVRQRKVDPRLLADEPRTIVAGFLDRSYRPGERATLVVTAPLRGLTVQVLRAGPERARNRRADVILGVPMGPARTIPWPGGPTENRALSWPNGSGQHRLAVPVGSWPSGLYLARLSAPGGWLGFAPFVVRPRRLGEHRIAVVLPTNTWEAYNFRDVDGDADGDTWYATPNIDTVNLQRPYLNRGVPPHYTGYDNGFVRWLAHTGKHVDVVSDDDYAAVARGDRLSRLYDLIVFSGHEEYVTPHVFDITERYRDLGGNLAFLSANDFFYRVSVEGDEMRGRTRYRDEGRPEAQLLGAQYLDWEKGRYPNRPYVVTGARTAPWFFRGTGLRNGDRFGGTYGIEINARTAESPPHTILLASIPNIFGPGKTAEMTYYETPRGAKVFDAGTINFGGTAEYPKIRTMMANLWARLSRP